MIQNGSLFLVETSEGLIFFSQGSPELLTVPSWLPTLGFIMSLGRVIGVWIGLSLLRSMIIGIAVFVSLL